MKKLLFALVFMLGSIGITQGQNYEFDNVERSGTGGIRALKDGNQVLGYISVVKLDNVSRKEKLYGVTILDENLQKTHYQEMVVDKRAYLVNQAFNQNSFCFAFMNYKKKTIDYVIYDLKLNEIGRLVAEDIHPSDLQNGSGNSGDDKLTLSNLKPVANKGYVRTGYVKAKGYKASVQMFDNSGELLWSQGTNYKGKMYEGADIHHVGEKMVISSVISKKSAFSSETKCFIVAHDINSGDEIYRIETIDSKHQMFPYDVSYNEKTNEFIVCGEYYKTGENIYKVKSQGFFIQSYEGKEGKLIKSSLINWNKDVAKKMPSKKKAGYKEMDVTIHKMVITENGKIYAIGEQFKKSISALGVASTVLSRGSGGGASSVQIEIHDLMAFEIDSMMELTAVHVFDKNVSKVLLPQGYGMVRGYLLANLLKMQGNFDHCYTAVSPDRQNFNAVYIDYDRENLFKGKYNIGVVGLNENNEVSSDLYELTTKPYSFYVCEAKPGYVAIVEYFKEDKKLSVRLEKSNIE